MTPAPPTRTAIPPQARSATGTPALEPEPDEEVDGEGGGALTRTVTVTGDCTFSTVTASADDKDAVLIELIVATSVLAAFALGTTIVLTTTTLAEVTVKLMSVDATVTSAPDRKVARLALYASPSNSLILPATVASKRTAV